jgi:hypothetical protein
MCDRAGHEISLLDFGGYDTTADNGIRYFTEPAQSSKCQVTDLNRNATIAYRATAGCASQWRRLVKKEEETFMGKRAYAKPRLTRLGLLRLLTRFSF